MRVAHVVSGLPVGGAERLVVQMLTRAPAGVEPSLVCIGGEGPLHAPLRAAGVPIHNLGKGRGPRPGAAVALAGCLRRLRPDLVHSHLLPADMYTAAALRLLPRPRPGWLATVHSVRPWRNGRQRALAEVGYRRAQALVGVSAEVKSVLEAARLQGPALHCIECGVAVAEFRLNPEDAGHLRRELGLEGAGPVVGAVGRLSPEKGHRYLIDACAALLTRLPKLHLVLVGDGPARAALESEAARLPFGRCLFLGSRPDAARLLALMDVVCLPSLYEGLPLALLEAMAAGKPVVASAVGGVPGVVSDGEHGLLVPPADPRALAEAIARLAEHPALAAALGAQAQARVLANYDVDRMNARYRALYAELLGKAAAHA